MRLGTPGEAIAVLYGRVPPKVPKREVRKWIAAAAMQPHGSKRPSRNVRCRPRAARGCPGPSRATSGAGFDVLPVYRDLRQCPKGKSGVVLNVKQAEKKGSGANPASTLAKGLVPKSGTRFPKGKFGQSGGMRPLASPRRSHMVARNPGDRGGRREAG